LGVKEDELRPRLGCLSGGERGGRAGSCCGVLGTGRVHRVATPVEFDPRWVACPVVHVAFDRGEDGNDVAVVVAQLD
jgi:hypothetical protein